MALLKAQEMANVLRCSVDCLWRYRKRGIIKAGVIHRKGTRLLLYDRDVVLQELNENNEVRGKW